MSEKDVDQASVPDHNEFLAIYERFRQELETKNLQFLGFICDVDCNQFYSPHHFKEISEMGLARLFVYARQFLDRYISNNPQIAYLIPYVLTSTSLKGEYLDEDKKAGSMMLPTGNLSIDPSGKLISDEPEDEEASDEETGESSEA